MPPPPSNWQDRWSASYIVADYMLPAGPIEIHWTSLDGMAHHVEIDLLKDIFPEREVLHNVPKEDVNEDWVRYEGGKISSPDILMEVNDRTINIYMKEMVLTKLPPRPERPDILFRSDLILAWTKTY